MWTIRTRREISMVQESASVSSALLRIESKAQEPKQMGFLKFSFCECWWQILDRYEKCGKKYFLTDRIFADYSLSEYHLCHLVILDFNIWHWSVDHLTMLELINHGILYLIIIYSLSSQLCFWRGSQFDKYSVQNSLKSFQSENTAAKQPVNASRWQSQFQDGQCNLTPLPVLEQAGQLACPMQVCCLWSSPLGMETFVLWSQGKPQSPRRGCLDLRLLFSWWKFEQAMVVWIGAIQHVDRDLDAG